MKCQKCGLDFPEREIQVSHDVPVYMFEGKDRNEKRNQADKFGRHNLCIKCHDIYERMVFAVMIKNLPLNLKEAMRDTAKRFASSYFSI